MNFKFIGSTFYLFNLPMFTFSDHFSVTQHALIAMIANMSFNSSNHSLCLHCREIHTRVFDVIQSIVPSRTYSNLRGGAHHEYLSSLRHISRSEASRLSEGAEKTTRSRRYALSMLNWLRCSLSKQRLSISCKSLTYPHDFLTQEGCSALLK